jgi:hypothetical protein
MTPERMSLMIWGGGGLLVVVLGWVWLGMRGADLDQARAKANDLHQRYVTLYHPDDPQQGAPVATAVAAAQLAMHNQQDDLARAENALVPDLLPQYRNLDLTSGATQVHIDHVAIRQRAQRQKMKLPSSLPLDNGLDPDEGKRAVQLAQLYLYRAVIDQCLESGVSRVDSVQLGHAESDPSGSYAVLTCDFELAATFEHGEMLLQNLLLAHKLGIGVLAVAIDGGQGDLQHLHLTASLITLNRDKLQAPAAPAQAAGPAPAGAATTTPAGTTIPHRRLGGD